MEKLTTLTGVAVPLRRSNVDTDQIIPAVFLKRVKKSGFDDALFYAWRRDPEFVLNKPEYKQGKILVAGPDFGIGSSREHAVWALHDYGFRVVIAPSFADIFHNNSFKNGLLPIMLAADEVDALFAQCVATEGYVLAIDLAAQTVTRADGVQHHFEVDAFRKHCLLNGLDDIGLTLQHVDAIRAFEAKHRAAQPWVFAGG